MKKITFQGKLLTTFIQKTRLPNGHIVNLEIVQHRGAVLIIPFLNKNKIILLKQFRPVINLYLYELPAGTLEKGENTLFCAKREIKEETGYSAKKLTRLGLIYPVPGYSTEKIIIYKAEELQKGVKLSQKDEVIELMLVTKNDIKQLFQQGKIVDAKTICALTMCGWL